MESLKPVKRKKRRTRKCLDEIRKRSRLNRNDAIEINYRCKVNEKCHINKLQHFNSNCITSNRLTLALYSKAVRSDTITRPVLVELGKNSLNLDNIVKDNKPVCTITSNALDTLEETSDIENNVAVKTSNIISLRKPNNTDSDSENICNSINSSDSCIVLSDQDSDRNVISPDVDLSFTHSSSLSSTTAQMEYNYRSYDEFICQIPIYLKHVLPVPFKDDVTKKTKAKLHNIFVKHCNQDYNSIIHHITDNSDRSNPIVEDPMDYIRLGYTWHSMSHELTRSPGEESQRSHSSELLGDSSETAHSISCSSQSSGLHTIVQDTPDYNYYPHKIN